MCGLAHIWVNHYVGGVGFYDGGGAGFADYVGHVAALFIYTRINGLFKSYFRKRREVRLIEEW